MPGEKSSEQDESPCKGDSDPKKAYLPHQADSKGNSPTTQEKTQRHGKRNCHAPHLRGSDEGKSRKACREEADSEHGLDKDGDNDPGVGEQPQQHRDRAGEEKRADQGFSWSQSIGDPACQEVIPNPDILDKAMRVLAQLCSSPLSVTR